MNVLILSQKTSDSYIDVICSALPQEANLYIVTGSELKRYEYIKSPAHDPRSLSSRLKCWYAYYSFVMKWVRNNKELRFDLIFANSNPPINGLLGTKLKKRYGAKFVYMNWDLYPQVIEQSMSGIVAKVFSKCWHMMNNRIYPKIDQMLTIGKVMSETVNASLKKKISIDVVPMFTDTQRMQPRAKADNPFCKENELDDKFVVLYSGKMGLAHNLEILLQAAELLKEYKDIVFVFIGHGPKTEVVDAWIKAHNSDNIRLFPLQSEEMFPYSMASGDIGFISQEAKAAKCFMPSKTYDMMAVGMALISYSEGTDDLANLVRDMELGTAMTEDNPEALAKNIMLLYKDKDLLSRYSENSRSLACEKYDIVSVTNEYARVFNMVLNQKE